MKKIIMFAVVLVFSAVIFYPVLAAPKKAEMGNPNSNEMSLSCQIVSTFLSWSLNHRPEYHKIADLDGNGVIDLGDLVMFAQNKFSNRWCSDKLGWYGDKPEMTVKDN